MSHFVRSKSEPPFSAVNLLRAKAGDAPEGTVDANPCAQSPRRIGGSARSRGAWAFLATRRARYLSAEEVPRYKPREPRPTRLGAFEAYIRRLIRETRMEPFAVIQIDVFADGTPGAD